MTNPTNAYVRLDAEERRLRVERAGVLAELGDALGTGLPETPIDEIDNASLTLGRELDAALLNDLDAALAEVAAARRRLDGGKYGLCTQCAARIPSERLAALPATRFCVEHAGVDEQFAGGRVPTTPDRWESANVSLSSPLEGVVDDLADPEDDSEDPCAEEEAVHIVDDPGRG